MKIVRASLLSCLLTAGYSLAFFSPTWASDLDDFHSRVVSIYSFEPNTLSTDQMKAKSGQLDQFWNFVKGDPSRNVLLLRRELNDPSNSPFFAYDGSELLLSLSSTTDDKALAMRSVAKVNLKSIQPTEYLRTVHRLASEGIDSRAAAFHILEEPKFQAFIPQHALSLGQDFCLIYMLFPMQESTYVQDLADQLHIQSDPTSIKSVLKALWYTETAVGDAAIAAFVADEKAAPEVLEFARGLSKRGVGVVGTLMRIGDWSSEQSLRKERQKVMSRPISDEALSEFDTLTAKIQSAR